MFVIFRIVREVIWKTMFFIALELKHASKIFVAGAVSFKMVWIPVINLVYLCNRTLNRIRRCDVSTLLWWKLYKLSFELK